MKTFKILRRDYSEMNPKKQFSITTIKSSNQEVAWQETELTISSGESQEWILTISEFKSLKQLFMEVK